MNERERLELEIEILELEREQALARQQQQQQAEVPLTEEAQRRVALGQQFGVPPQDIDLQRSVPFTQRMGLGLMSDNPEERENYLRQQYERVVPTGDTFAVQNPGGPVMVADPEGFWEWGTLGELIGSTGPAMVGVPAGVATGAALGLTGPGAVIGGAAAGAGVSELVREGIQGLAGVQEETPEEYLTRAAVAGTIEGVAGVAGRGIVKAWRALKDRGIERMAGVTDQDLPELIRELAQEGEIDLPKLMAYQKTDSPIVERLAAQATQMDQKSGERLARQLEDLRQASLAAAPEVEGRSMDDVVQQRMKETYRERMEEMAPAPRTSQAGRQVQEGVTQGLDARKQRMTDQYAKVEELIKEWEPNYDLTPAQQAAREREVMGMALSPEEQAELLKATGSRALAPSGFRQEAEAAIPTSYKNVRGFLNVADPNTKLRRINAVMARLDPTQDYATVKELRTQVGNMLDMPLSRRMESGLDIGQAKRLYGELSSVLENPQGVVPGVATGIRNQTREANALARRYYDSYDKSMIGRTLLSKEQDTPTALFNEMASNPSIIEESFRDLLDDAGDNVEIQRTLRNNLESLIMRSSDPVNSMRGWRERAGEAYNWLYPTQVAKDRAEANARIIAEMNSQPMRIAEDAASERTGFALQTLNDRVKRKAAPGMSATRNMRTLVDDLGGVGSEGHTALRQAVYTDLINKGVKRHQKSGEWSIDPEALAVAKKEWIEKGAVDGVLTGRDRRVLGAIEKFAKRSWTTGDSGTGLAVAAQVGQLRQGNPKAIFDIYAAQRMARMLTSTSVPFESLLRFLPKTSKLASPALSQALLAFRQGYVEPLVTEQITEEEQQ